MYYLIRIIFIVVLVSTTIFAEIIYLRKQVKKGKQYTRRRLRIISLTLRFSVLFIALLSFIPFEAPFLHFDSVEDALRYKWIDPENITVHYEDDCAFAVKRTYEIYAFDKDENGFGFVNYHSTEHKYHLDDYSVHSKNIGTLYSVYHKKANKTFYLINYVSEEYQKDEIDCDTLDLKFFTHPLYEKNLVWFGDVPTVSNLYQAYDITDGKPVQRANVSVNQQFKTFVY